MPRALRARSSRRETPRSRDGRSGIADHGQRVGSGDPVGIDDAGEKIAARSAGQGNASQRAQAEGVGHGLRTEQRGDVTGAGDGQDPP